MDDTKNFARLKRPRHPIPAFVREALLAHGLMAAYQQNDYLGWINRAKCEAPKQKRLGQMLAELETDDMYMKMSYYAKR